jgi:hypothetical protein
VNIAVNDSKCLERRHFVNLSKGTFPQDEYFQVRKGRNFLDTTIGET